MSNSIRAAGTFGGFVRQRDGDRQYPDSDIPIAMRAPCHGKRVARPPTFGDYLAGGIPGGPNVESFACGGGGCPVLRHVSRARAAAGGRFSGGTRQADGREYLRRLP